MFRTGLVSCLVLALACAPAEVLSSSTPLLAWSSRELLVKDSLQYQSSQTEQLLNQLLLGALGRLSESSSQEHVQNAKDKADLVVVVLGSQVDAGALRRAASLEPLKQLTASMQAAATSLVLPYLQFKGESLAQELRTQLQNAGLGFQAVGCFSESTDVAADVQRAVSLDQSLEVLLVCAPPAQGSRSAALEAEVALVDSVQSAVQKAQKNALYVYANQPTLRPSKRRSMQAAGGDTLSGFGSYTTCGPLCKTQVAWLQGMLGLTFCSLALCAGFACLNMVNTPTRFETSKEGQ